MMEFPRSVFQHENACVIVGNKASGKTFLASQVRDVSRIESADLLLWCALADTSKCPDPNKTSWHEEISKTRASMSFQEVRTCLANFIRKTTPKVIGELQTDFINRAPRPLILVGVRYLETVRELHVAGYPIVYVEPSADEQERRLAALQGISQEEARDLLQTEKNKCELERCMKEADVVVRNHYDIRSARAGAMVLASIVTTNKL